LEQKAVVLAAYLVVAAAVLLHLFTTITHPTGEPVVCMEEVLEVEAEQLTLLGHPHMLAVLVESALWLLSGKKEYKWLINLLVFQQFQSHPI
jgi:hypothetical protein